MVIPFWLGSQSVARCRPIAAARDEPLADYGQTGIMAEKQ
jgi:hypothetical protein